jgi:hypothetical protein
MQREQKISATGNIAACVRFRKNRDAEESEMFFLRGIRSDICRSLTNLGSANAARTIQLIASRSRARIIMRQDHFI